MYKILQNRIKIATECTRWQSVYWQQKAKISTEAKLLLLEEDPDPGFLLTADPDPWCCHNGPYNQRENVRRKERTKHSSLTEFFAESILT